MSIDNKTEPIFFQKVVDIGLDKNFSIAEIRYLRVANIASLLGASYNLIWMLIAIQHSDLSIIYGTNAALALMFLLVLFFNAKGWRVLAAIWLTLAAYVSVFLFMYLLGYTSGVVFVCFLIIILPYMTFPKKARRLAHGFSISACITLIVTVVFQSKISAHYDNVDPYLSQVVNVSITGIICLALIWSMSVLIDRAEESLIAEQKKSDDLLYNILPVNVAKDLKETGKTIPQKHESVSILFTDFKGFTKLVSSISEITLVNELNEIFRRFDEIMEETGVEKIETIGDAYVAACGFGKANSEHALQCVQAAQLMLSFLEERNMNHEIQWKMRVGIHSGPIVAGVIGKKKYRYDLFGDTINTASRMESSSEASRINISGQTYELVKNQINCEFRGKIHAKGKGKIDMYFVE